MPLDRLTAEDADAAARRRELGRLLGADLAGEATAVAAFRLLVRGEPVGRAELAGVLRDETVECGAGAGLFDVFDVDGSEYLRATACVLPERLPNGDVVWIACDQPWEDTRADHVPGPGNASRTLMNALPAEPVQMAADIGTGCGVVALYLSTFAEHVIATDVSTRALAFAELTAALNGREWELRSGSFADPIAGQHVDLVAVNPPFVLGNPDAPAVFRDGSFSLAADLVSAFARELRPGAVAVLLGNWPYIADGADPTASVRAAAVGAECTLVERAVVPPEEYVRVWVDEDDELARRWAANLRAAGVLAIGTGIVTLNK